MALNINKKQAFVDVISPALAIDFTELEKIKLFLENNSIKSNFFDEKNLIINERPNNEFAAISPELRFKQFESAINNDQSNIIWVANGGYGAIDLVPFFKKIKKPKKPKIFIGFSDITIFNKLLIEKFNWPVVVGPMLGQIINKKVSDDSIKEITDLVLQNNLDLNYQLQTLLEFNKNISGQIVGGCLSVMAAQFGTKNQLNFKNKILFLEDEGESGERLDRYFSHLLQIMNDYSQYPCGVVLGNFFQENIHGNIVKENIEIAIAKFVTNIAKLNKKISVFRDKNSQLGHSKNMMPLVLGIKSEINDGNLRQVGLSW